MNTSFYQCADYRVCTQEQKKLRKQRRQAELQDKRDRIRMGILPPDAPKGSYSKLDGFQVFADGSFV